MVGAELLAGLQAFNAMFNGAKALKDMNDSAVRNAAVIELQEQILSAQAQQATLISRVSELEEKVRGFETWDAEKQRYEMHELGRGTMAYRRKADTQPTEPAHFICPDCYQNGDKSILQHVIRHPGRCDVRHCQRCGWEAYVSGAWTSEHGGRPATRRT